MQVQILSRLNFYIMTSNSNEFLWVQKYRPQTIDECILPTPLKKTLKGIVDTKQVQNMIFTGTAGLGKTTAALAICSTLNLDYLLINCSEDSGIDVLRNRIRQFASTVSLSGAESSKVVILDEADYLNCFTENQKIIIRNSQTGDEELRSIKSLLGQEFEVKTANPQTLETSFTPSAIVEKGEQEVFLVEFEDGSTMECTADHKFFDENGKEIVISEKLKLLNV